MPNWCENKLLILADGKDALDDFKGLEALFNETLKYDSETSYVENLLDSIIPMPEVLRDTTEKEPYKLPSGGTIWWYSWCWDNWGTKWDAVDCIMYKKVTQSTDIKFTFLTAYAPPIPWLEKLGSIFPNLWLKLEYDEPGMCFKGVACGRGEIIDEYEEYE